ncbi:hypothetical protein ABMA28_009881 [Loxostege sticticalis]|uniref:PHD-type domain-containing protein n=1 Tax=Loxostege sticticalis TaxID=481309 RepID=A0ABD0SCA8_LOXSC
MKSCTRVKNACKICLQSVTNKTGVQCQGACKKWAHFTCLQYTPGKIADIKAGLITITCPCPNCNTQEPKEYLTDPPFTCNNQECPANKVPKCEKDDCPLNKPVSRGVSPAQIGPPPCGPACATAASRTTPPTSSPEMVRVASQPKKPSPPKVPLPEPSLPPCVSCTRQLPPCMSIPVVSEHATPPRAQSPRACSPRAQSPRTVTPKRETSSRSSRTPSQRNVYAENKPIPPQLKSASCSCMSKGTVELKSTKEMVNASNQNSVNFEDKPGVVKSGDCKASCSDSKLNKKDSKKVLLCSIQELCSTVGQLSAQIKDLMCKMMMSIDDKNN